MQNIEPIELRSYKHNESNTYVHVRDDQIFLSKGLLDQYYFHLIPADICGYFLRPIRHDSFLFYDDREFNIIIPALEKVLLSPMVLVHQNGKFNPHQTLLDNNYSLVDTYSNVDIRDAVSIISKLPLINDKHYLDTTKWNLLGSYHFDNTPRDLFSTEDEFIVKYDSTDSNKGMYTYSVFYQTQSTGEIFVHLDSIFNIELPYVLFGNLINTIIVDDDDRCINQEEYEKYIALSKHMLSPRLEERKPITQ